MICSVVATSISDCGVCTACRVVCDYTTRHTVHTPQPEILVATTPQIIYKKNQRDAAWQYVYL